jgi:nitroreductase
VVRTNVVDKRGGSVQKPPGSGILGPPRPVRPHGADLCKLLTDRRNTSPRRLVAPGPDEAAMASFFVAAAAAPDHGRLTPWRFVRVPVDQRHRLAEAFALALVDRDPGATLVQIEAARNKAYRAPSLMLAVVRCGGAVGAEIRPAERLVSLGAAIQNILLAAHAMGFASGLTSGQAMHSARLRGLFRLAPDEEAVCFVNLGTAIGSRPRPAAVSPERFVSSL